MTKTRKILVIVLFSILGLLIVVASILAVYAVNLYNKMNYDPDATFAPTVEINDPFLTAYDKLLAGVPIEEVIQDPDLTEDQIEALKQYAEELKSDVSGTVTTGTGTLPPVTTMETPDITLPPETQMDNVINLLLLGTDERPGELQTRSDSMIVVSINRDTKEITFTSLLRDMYIAIDGFENSNNPYNKLNSAYRFGGVNGLCRTIEKSLGIFVDKVDDDKANVKYKYVHVNFDSFQDVIDSIGGVDVAFSDIKAVRRAEVNRLKRYTDFSENQLVSGTTGTYHLNGEQALYYCRDRYSGNTVDGALDGDFGRTDRQRKVLNAIVKKAQSMSLLELNDAMPTILSKVDTNLTLDDCSSLLLSVATSYADFNVRNYSIPADDTWEYDTKSVGSVLAVNYSKNAELWRKLIYGE